MHLSAWVHLSHSCNSILSFFPEPLEHICEKQVDNDTDDYTYDTKDNDQVLGCVDVILTLEFVVVNSFFVERFFIQFRIKYNHTNDLSNDQESGSYKPNKDILVSGLSILLRV